MKQEILLTVAIPNYNGGENLIRAIRSCRNINLPVENFEILLVDNCSTDNSVENAKKLLNEFPNLRIEINEKNLGRVGNWNRCLELARGKYLVFLFVNDEITNDVDFKSAIQKLEEDEKINIIFNRVRYIYDEKNIYETPKYYQDYAKIKTYNFIKEIFYKNADFVSFGILQQHIYRMSVIKRNGIKFNENVDRTTDRMFICDVAFYDDGYIYFMNKIQINWYLNENRYHYKTHINPGNIDLIEAFNKSWGQELYANSYILKKIGLSQIEILRKHYEKFYYYNLSKRIRKIIIKGNVKTVDDITLPVFIKLLEINMDFWTKLNIKFLSYFKILIRILKKFLKLFQKKDG